MVEEEEDGPVKEIPAAGPEANFTKQELQLLAVAGKQGRHIE